MESSSRVMSDEQPARLFQLKRNKSIYIYSTAVYGLSLLLQQLLDGSATLDDIGHRVLDLQELLEGEVRDLLAVAMHLEVVRVPGDDFDEEEIGGTGWSREGRRVSSEQGARGETPTNQR